MRLSTIILSILVVALAGCNDTTQNKAAEPAKTLAASSPAADNAHAMITRYNQLLSEGYKTINMTKLQEVATQELAERAYYHMAAIGEGKSRMVSELKKIDFKETDCSKLSNCRVVTKETWDFAYADIHTGQKSNEVKDYIYEVQYVLKNRQGTWLITEITATGEDRKDVPTWDKMFKKQQ